MNPQLIADLERARALIDTPEKWNKTGSSATDASGNAVPACSDDARCFCVFGAIRRAVSEHTHREDACLSRLYLSLGFTNGPERLFRWNDAPERTHAEVLAAFDRAITNERSKA